MTIYPYNSGIPNPPNDPADDVTTMQTNAASIAGFLGVDHTAFGITGNGYHKQVTFQLDVNSPSLANAVGALHTKTVSGNHELFYLNGVKDSQITGGATAATNGSTILPSGIILQWGTSTANTGDTVISTGFANNLFNVLISPGNALGANSFFIKTISSPSSFTVTKLGIGSITFYWLAIGN